MLNNVFQFHPLCPSEEANKTTKKGDEKGSANPIGCLQKGLRNIFQDSFVEPDPSNSCRLLRTESTGVGTQQTMGDGQMDELHPFSSFFRTQWTPFVREMASKLHHPFVVLANERTQLMALHAATLQTLHN